jgi:ABC-type Fe3+-hydroxamate transport system substrate-binding protein
MDSKSAMIIAAVLIAVIAIAAAAIFMSGQDKSGEEQETVIGVALPVYGNADLDSDIDNNDLNIIEKIIAGGNGYTLASYPFADANRDGKVNSQDSAIVKKIINKESTTVYHLNYYNDGAVNVKTKIVDTKWPCEDLMVTYNSVMFTLTSLGVDDKVVGATAVGKVSLDKYMYANIMKNAEALKTSYDSSWNSMMDISSVSKIMLDHPKAHTMFVSAYGQYDVYNEAEVEKVGCDIVRLCESNPTRDETLASVLLAGFLTNTLDRAKELTSMYAEIWDACTKISSNLPTEDKQGYVVTAGSTTMAGTSNQHGYKCLIAGGKSVLGTENQSPGTWMLEDEYNKNIDKILIVAWSNANNGFFFGNHELNPDVILANYTEGSTETVWEMTDAWKNKEVYVVYGDFPTAFDLLARGYAMYPDYFGSLYEKSCAKLLTFISDGEFAGKNIKFVYSLSDLENY